MAEEHQFTLLKPKDFPSLLREINDPPQGLYLEGVLPPPDFVWLAVVGSRRYSTYGREACEELIGGLKGLPVAIVSGLALGIDALAHQAALAARLLTVGVPGSGLDRSVLHPAVNHRLADEIVAAGGCLLSEMELTEPAGIHSFPRRNRIMAGLAQATLIVEAAEKSGTLITARLAMEYNRDVLVIPNSIFSPNSAGSNRLIKDGAHPILSPADLRTALGLEKKEDRTQTTLPLDLSDKEKTVLELIAIESLAKDDLIVKLGWKTHETNILLSALELKGLIKETLGEIRLV